jgi:hypothetical protein
MRSLFAKGIVVIGSVALVVVAGWRNLPTLARYSADDAAFETTGSIGPIRLLRGRVSLTAEQRQRVQRGVMGFADAANGDAPMPELADELSIDEPMQDLPATVTEEIPLLRAHKFVKLADRILLVDPTSRTVVAMIPRYRLLP